MDIRADRKTRIYPRNPAEYFSYCCISEAGNKRKSSNDHHNHYNDLAQPQSCNYTYSRPSTFCRAAMRATAHQTAG